MLGLEGDGEALCGSGACGTTESEKWPITLGLCRRNVQVPKDRDAEVSWDLTVPPATAGPSAGWNADRLAPLLWATLVSEVSLSGNSCDEVPASESAGTVVDEDRRDAGTARCQHRSGDGVLRKLPYWLMDAVCSSSDDIDGNWASVSLRSSAYMSYVHNKFVINSVSS
jgi:hypothetical protein